MIHLPLKKLGARRPNAGCFVRQRIATAAAIRENAGEA